MCIHARNIGYKSYMYRQLSGNKCGQKTHWLCQYFLQIAVNTVLCSQILLSAGFLQPPLYNPAPTVHSNFILLLCFSQVALLMVLHSTIFIPTWILDCFVWLSIGFIAKGNLTKEANRGWSPGCLLFTKEWGLAGSYAIF